MRKLYSILIIMFVLMSISCVFASDNTNETIYDNSVNVHVDNTTALSTNENNHVDNTPVLDTISENDTAESYDDLKNHIEKDLQSGDTFNLIKDYKFNAEGQTFYLNGNAIVINQDNIIINGNGHTVNAGGLDNFAIFNVLGNNVTITNLKFINSIPGSINSSQINNTEYKMISSPISWEGNNGVIKNCDFYNNCAVNGGSISWMGNNGSIDNCSFVNSTAIGVGGAIYIGGTNNTISNCLFAKANSLLGESIYIDRNRKNITFKNNTLSSTENESSYIIDGAVSNIDVNYLQYSHRIYAYGNIISGQSYNVDIIPLLFKDIMLGGTINDGHFEYNDIYDNMTGDFTFNIIGHNEMLPFNENHGFDYDYLKSIRIGANITDFNQVFSAICQENYQYNITQLITGYIYNAQDYEKLSKVRASGLWFNKDEGYITLTNVLKFVFTDALIINSDITWNPTNKGFDIITIMGNGSTINGGAEDRDEKKCIVMNDPNALIIINNLTIKGFNTAVECLQGTCYFNNVNFNNNRMDYYIDRDWGAGILNTGALFCNNCTFTDNYAKNGGAIFNQGYLSLDNCTFKRNTAYGLGNDVCVVMEAL